MKCILALLACCFVLVAASDAQQAPAKPNLVYILMDDTDVMLGSDQMLKQARKLVADEGVLFGQVRANSLYCLVRDVVL